MSHPSPTRPGRTVSLTPQLNDFLDRQVARGRHQSAGEVIREALRRYEAEREAEAVCLGMIHAIARAGRSAIERGDFVAIETEQARHDLFRRLTGRNPPWVQPDPASRGVPAPCRSPRSPACKPSDTPHAANPQPPHG